MNNPYQTTETVIQQQLPQSNPRDLQLDANDQIALIGSKGWVKFLSVMGFISFTLTIRILIVALSLSSTRGFGLVWIIIGAVIAVVIFKLSNRLLKYARAIQGVMECHDPIEFERAMEEQMKFWELFGILTIICLVLLALILIAAIV